jgi:uncharacterized protein (DUF1684 family)
MRLGQRHLGLVLAGALLLAHCGSGAPDAGDVDYAQRLLKDRAATDQQFRNSPNKPIPPEAMSALLPLSYFPPDPDYVVPAELKLAAQREIVDMPTSTGEVRKEERVGVLAFVLKGQPMTLAAFHEAGTDMTHLFIPFRDLTSGTETYQAGRYLDLERTPTGLYNIDFNRAYNPYCYYSSQFDCPYPPPENRLTIPVRAGQRLPPSTTH